MILPKRRATAPIELSVGGSCVWFGSDICASSRREDGGPYKDKAPFSARVALFIK